MGLHGPGLGGYGLSSADLPRPPAHWDRVPRPFPNPFSFLFPFTFAQTRKNTWPWSQTDLGSKAHSAPTNCESPSEPPFPVWKPETLLPGTWGRADSKSVDIDNLLKF